MNLLQNISLSHVLHIAETSCLYPKTTQIQAMEETQSISVEDYFMGICFQPWNKIAEYDQRAFVYQFAPVHLAALLNETNLSKRKRKHTFEYLLYISEAILLSLSVNNFFLSLLSL